MAMAFNGEIRRLLTLKVGNQSMDVVVEMGEDGLKFKRKGKRKTIEVSWMKLLSGADLLTPVKDGPELTGKEISKIASNPLAFLIDA